MYLALISGVIYLALISQVIYLVSMVIYVILISRVINLVFICRVAYLVLINMVIYLSNNTVIPRLDEMCEDIETNDIDLLRSLSQNISQYKWINQLRETVRPYY